MDKIAITAEIAKLNESQRKAIRQKLAKSVRPGDSVVVFKARRGAHVYIRSGNEITSALLGPRGRIIELKLRVA